MTATLPRERYRTRLVDSEVSCSIADIAIALARAFLVPFKACVVVVILITRHLDSMFARESLHKQVITRCFYARLYYGYCYRYGYRYGFHHRQTLTLAAGRLMARRLMPGFAPAL